MIILQSRATLLFVIDLLLDAKQRRIEHPQVATFQQSGSVLLL